MFRSSHALLLATLISAPASLTAQSAPPGEAEVSVTQVEVLQQENPDPQRFFGEAVALQDDVLVIGTTGDGVGGTAEVFVLQDDVWTPTFVLEPNDAAADWDFGVSIAIDGDTILVGAPGADASGAAYAFLRSEPDALTWDQQAKLTSSDLATNDDFGYDVAFTLNTAVIGAPRDDDGGPRSGSAYVFTREAGVWTQEAKLVDPAPRAEDRFGHSVAFDEERALVGVPHIDFPNNFTGHAVTFTRSGTSWSSEATLTPFDGLAGDGFGSAVALQGVRALVGAPFDDDLGLQTGSAFAFRFVLPNWIELGKVTDSAGGPGDQAGSSVALGGSLAFIGAPLADGPEAGDEGRVIVARFPTEGGIVQTGTATPSLLVAGGRYGDDVAAHGTQLLVGAPESTSEEVMGEDVQLTVRAGQAYLFDTEDPLFESFVDLGNALEGAAGFATLTGTGELQPGTSINFTLSNGAPNEMSIFFIGLTRIDAPLKGGVLVPNTDGSAFIVLDGNGAFDLTTGWPSDLGSGFEFYYQVWWADAGGLIGAAASNALQSTVP